MTQHAAQPQTKLNGSNRPIKGGVAPWERPFEELLEESIRENDELFRLLAQGPPKDLQERQ